MFKPEGALHDFSQYPSSQMDRTLDPPHGEQKTNAIPDKPNPVVVAYSGSQFGVGKKGTGDLAQAGVEKGLIKEVKVKPPIKKYLR